MEGYTFDSEQDVERIVRMRRLEVCCNRRHRRTETQLRREGELN